MRLWLFLLVHNFPSWSITFLFLLFSPQRGTMRRRYEDDGISDDEIEGKRTFDLEEKLSTNKFNSTFVVFMEGKGLSWDCWSQGARVGNGMEAARSGEHGAGLQLAGTRGSQEWEGLPGSAPVIAATCLPDP